MPRIHRSRTFPAPPRVSAFGGVLIVALALAATCAAQQPSLTLMFGVSPSMVYGVEKNGAPLTTTFSSVQGVARFADSTAPGDRYVVGADSTVDTQPPSPPVILDLEESGAGCVRPSWLPSGDPTVVGYVVGYGVHSVASGDATVYDHSVEAGNVALRDVCGLQSGTYYVAVRARNHLGILSAYSAELSIEITSTPVMITNFDATASGRTVVLRWDVFSDEALAGYRVYRNERDGAGRGAPVHGDEDLPTATSSYVDGSIQSGTWYRYTLVVIRADGGEAGALTRTVRTGAWSLELEQNSPNPFNPETAISFTLPEAAPARLDVFDVGGRLVVTLVDKPLPSGRHTVRWNGTDRFGAPVATGAYFYRLTAGKRRISRKMLLLK